MNNGIMFGAQGPMMTGTWYNPNTGDSFTVRDCFFENNQYVVSTTDGRVLSYDMIQHYVQSDKPIEMSKTPQQETLPTEVADLIADDIFIDDDIYGVNNPLTPSLGNITKPLPYSVKEETPSFNVGIIKKALDKYTRPQVDCNIVWDNFPKKEIQMLNEIMEIDTKDIVEWYASQLDTTEIAITIHNSLVRYINDQLYGRVPNTIEIDLTLESEKPTEREPINATGHITRTFTDTPKTPKKSSPKKTTKKSTKK